MTIVYTAYIQSVRLINNKEIKMAKSNKVKSDKFRELAHSRVNRAINMIRLIANLGNKAHYDYSTDQQKRIFAALENEVKKAKNKFTSNRQGTDEFSL